MNKIILFLLSSVYIFAQSPTCSTVAPMCGDGGLTFQNTTNGANNQLNVGCLDDTLNQAWFFMQVGSNGNMNFQISQVSNTGGQIDVDFICWGPFPENSVPNTLCTQLFDFPNNNPANGNNIIACSYSPNAVENFSINNAVQGQIYILLITNFSNQPGNITLSQTNINQPGAGTTSCDVVCNVSLGGDQTICNGVPITLTANLVANTFQPGVPTFQWFKDGLLITGATGSTLSVSQTGQYQVVVTRAGCASNPPPSDTINVNFGGNAVINTSPPNLICSNNETFNLGSISTTILNGNIGNLVFYNNLTDAQNQNNPILNTTNFAGINGQTICAKVNITGDTCPYFSCFTLSCLPPPCPLITNPLGNQSVCLDNNPLPISVNVANAISVGFFYFNTPQTGNNMYTGGTLLGYVNNSSGNAVFDPSDLGTLNSLPNVLGTYYIYAIPNPTPQFTTCRPFQEIIIQVVNPPTPAVISGNSIQCQGNSSTFLSNVAGFWSSSNNAIITINSISGVATGISGGSAKIRFTIPATPTCSAVTSEFDVVVNPIPPSPIPQQAVTYCENAIVPFLQATGNQLLWYTTPTGGTGFPQLRPDTTIIGTTLYYVTQTILGCESPRASVAVTINAIPVVSFTNTAPVLCNGESTQISFSSNVNNPIYYWNVTSGGQTGAEDGIGTQFVNQILTNTTQSPIQVVYTITAEANTCANISTPSTITVVVNPTPNVIINPANNFSICSGESANINFSGSVLNTVFTYTASSTSGITGFTPSGTGTNISDILVNSSLLEGSVTYIVTPIFGNCIGLPKQITISVKPRPVAIPLNTSYAPICSGNTPVGVTFNSTNPNTAFIFTAVQEGVSGAFDGDTYANVNGSLFLDFQVLINNGTTQGYVEYTITPVLNGCKGVPIKAKILVNPLPKPVLKDGVICIDENGLTVKNIVINSGLDASNHTFQWTYTNPNGVQIQLPNNSNELVVSQVGSYQVVATNTNTGCVSFPSNPSIITSSTIATSMIVNNSLAFATNSFIEINVLNGTGNYLYQLNNGAWQTSNVFENVNFGNHIVRVTDTLGCTNLSQNVKIIQHQTFFTPNADGFNDTWKLFGLEDQIDVTISIFNRYGKLLKQLSALETSNGWDGTYLGNPLPADDYWFSLNYKENNEQKTFKSHFSLKR